MNSEIQELKPDLSCKEQELLFNIIKTALNTKSSTVRIPISSLEAIFPEIDKEVLPEHLINILVKFMSLPVPVGKKYVPLFTSWNLGRENIMIQFSDEIVKSTPEKSFQYVIEMYCNPNKRSFYYRQIQ